MENPRSHIVVLANPKLHSRDCMIYWNFGVYAKRVPRMEFNFVFIYKLLLLDFVTHKFWRGRHCEGWKLCRVHFCEVPPKEKTFLEAKMAFDRH